MCKKLIRRSSTVCRFFSIGTSPPPRRDSRRSWPCRVLPQRREKQTKKRAQRFPRRRRRGHGTKDENSWHGMLKLC